LKDLVKLIQEKGKSFLGNIVTNAQPEMKNQSKQWLKKRMLGPIKARDQASREKWMVLCFFDQKGLIYTTMYPRGKQ